MIVRDRSQNIGGTLTGHRSLPDVPAPRNAVVPGATSTEVAIVVGDQEPCSAAYADESRGQVNAGPQHDGLPPEPQPATAYPGVAKAHSVSTHPDLMRAHQLSTISHDDHQAIHGATKCAPLQKSESATGPVVANLGRQPMSNNIVRSGPAQERPTSSTGVTARIDKGGKVYGPAVANPRGDRFGSI